MRPTAARGRAGAAPGDCPAEPAPLGNGAPYNPFTTSQLEADDYLVPANLRDSLDELVARLGELGGRAQVLGAPGSGKTALLRALGRVAGAQGHRTALIRADREPRAAHVWLAAAAPAGDHEPLLLCDEADTLARRSLRALSLGCRERGAWLVATSHRSLGLPTLQRCVASAELATRIAARLLAHAPAEHRLVAPEDAAAAWQAARGDLHATLAALYRLHEMRWQQRTAATSSSSSRRS